MRIHTNNLTMTEIDRAARIANVWFTRCTMHGSRTHKRAFDIILSGDSPYKQNFSGEDYAATWDQWGIFLAALFEADITIKTPYYSDRSNFHWLTGERFLTLTVDNQHKRHNWVSEGKGTFQCSGCEAYQRNGYGSLGAMPEGYMPPAMPTDMPSVFVTVGS